MLLIERSVIDIFIGDWIRIKLADNLVEQDCLSWCSFGVKSLLKNYAPGRCNPSLCSLRRRAVLYWVHELILSLTSLLDNLRPMLRVMESPVQRLVAVVSDYLVWHSGHKAFKWNSPANQMTIALRETWVTSRR